MTDILIVEDDLEMGELLKDFMIKEGFTTHLSKTAEEALEILDKERTGMVLLDVMLPKMDGFETCATIREKQNIPILMMSAMTDEESKLLGYDTGADDYIDKPFSVRILMAKIKALLKRNNSSECNETLVGYGIELDPISRHVTKDGLELKLNAKEFDLLQYLMEHKGVAVRKEELFNAVWGFDCFTEPSTVSVHICWLREKIEKDPNIPKIIKTVWKVGYRFGEQI